MIDWERVARRFWMPDADVLSWARSVSARLNMCAVDCGVAAQRISNLGRALAGAGMLATLEQRAEACAYAIARQSLNWRRP